MKKPNSNSNGLWTALAIVLIILLIRYSCTGKTCYDIDQSYDISSCLGINAPSGFGGGSSRGAGAGGRR